MYTAVRLLLLRWLAARTLGGVAATTLLAALPIAAALKAVGLPVLAAMAAVAAPVALGLVVLGLPVLIVVTLAGAVAAAAGAAAMLAWTVLKYVLPVLLVGWAVARLVRTLRRRTAEADAVRPTPAPVEGPGA